MDTRQQILEAARARFMHYGYKKTTIDEIASDAGVGKGTVYLYFQSKEDILLTIAKGVKRSITDQMRAIASTLGPPEEKLRRMMIASIMTVYDAAQMAAHGLELVDELKPKIRLCAREDEEAQLAILVSVIAEGVKRGEFTVPDGDVRAAAHHFDLAFTSFYPPALPMCHDSLTCRHDLEGRISKMTDFLLNGLRRR